MVELFGYFFRYFSYFLKTTLRQFPWRRNLNSKQDKIACGGDIFIVTSSEGQRTKQRCGSCWISSANFHCCKQTVKKQGWLYSNELRLFLSNISSGTSWLLRGNRHFRYENGTGAEMRPAIISGIATGDASVSYWPIFSPVLRNSPRRLFERFPLVSKVQLI